MTKNSNGVKKILLITLAVMLTSGCALQTELNKFRKGQGETPKQEEQAKQVQPDLSKEGLSADRQEEKFNESGQAKAIVDESDLWMVYENEEAEFSFKYPGNVSMEKEEGKMLLSVNVIDIDEMENEAPLGFGKKMALENKKALENKEYGKDVDFPLQNSKEVRELNLTNAQEFMVLSRFEVCDVAFERKLYFFNNDQQIIITLKSDKENIVKEMPEFFATNKENCGEEKIWNFDLQETFYDNLINGAGSKTALGWFKAFDEVVNTIKFYGEEEKEDVKTSHLDLIQGSWISLDDAKSVIKFTSSTKIDFYENKKITEDDFVIEEDHLVVGIDEDLFEYTIVKITDNNLVLTYLPRGNTLLYERINY